MIGKHASPKMTVILRRWDDALNRSQGHSESSHRQRWFEFCLHVLSLSRDFRVGVPWELFFADDLVIIATSLEECVERVKAWKEGLESKGLHVNMTKTKFMASGLGLDILQDSGKFPCAVCRTGVGRSSIRCSKCNLWVHYKKCSGLKTLSEDLSYECPRCRGVPGVRPVDGRPFKEVEVGDCVLEAVDRFCYLGDMLSAGGGCMAAAIARCRCAWGKFRENLPLLTSKPVPFYLRGRLFSSNVRSSMLHGTETWPMTSAALHRLCRNDRAMIRWICGVKPSDDPSMDELHAKLGICDLAILVRERRLRWFGHVMRSNGEINRVRSRPVPGRKGPGRPKKTWEECVKQDLKVCGLSEAGTQDRLSWRSSVKNSRQEPTPSNGSLPQSMAEPPARRVLGMRTRSFNKTGFDWLIDRQLFIKNVVAVAAYSRLASRSQAKFQTMKLSPLSALRAATPAQSTISTCRSLRFSSRSCSDVNLTRTVPVAFPGIFEARNKVIWWLLTSLVSRSQEWALFHITFDIKRLLFRLEWRVVRCLSTKQDGGTTWPIFDGCSTPDRTARLHWTGRLHSVTGPSRPGPAGWRLGREARLKFPTRRRMTGRLGGWWVSRGARLGSEWRARDRGRPSRRGWPSTWWWRPSRRLLTQHMMLTTQHMLQKRFFNFLPSFWMTGRPSPREPWQPKKSVASSVSVVGRPS